MSILLVILYKSFANVTFVGNWVKDTQDLPKVLLATVLNLQLSP